LEPNHSHFAKSLHSAILNYIEINGRYANWFFWVKAIVLFTTWIVIYVYLNFFHHGAQSTAFFFGLIWGILSLLMIFNIGHDAVHGVVSKRKWINNLLGYTFNISGGNRYSWYLKHNLAHHLNTNTEGLDFDTALDPLLRVSSKAKYRSYYRWQILWVLPVYSLLSLLIIFVADIAIFFQTKKAELVKKHALKEWLILIGSKLFYLVIVFVIPTTFGQYMFTDILKVFFAFQLINGLVIACVFMPSHYFNNSTFYTSKKERPKWTLHQLQTTMDLSPRSKITTQILGGLNLNVAHHLYPNFCHNHYFEIDEMIRKSCKADQIEYHSKSYPAAIVDHVKYLNHLGRE